MSRPRIVVTRRWPSVAEEALVSRFDTILNPDDHPLSREALAQAIGDADAVLPTVTDTIDADLLDGGGKCRLIGNFGVGVNNIDIESARAAGMTVTNTPGVLTDATADLAMTLLLMCARRASEGEAMLRAGDWAGWAPTQLIGHHVTGKTLGIVGFGRIGIAMARRAHFGFGMSVLFTNRSTVTDHGIPGARQCALEELLVNADFVSLHCPGGAETRHMINQDALGLMRPDACLVNTARGDVIDEAALIDALQRGEIAGAGLDVFEQEPAVPDALRLMSNVSLLPHMGSATHETREAMGMKVVENVIAFFEGRTPPDRVV